MGRIRKKQNPDRYLVTREGNYYYKRRVPTQLVEMDGRGEHVRISMKTDDLAQARATRDIYELADDELWASMTVGAEGGEAKARYLAAVKRAQSLGFVYRSSFEISKGSVDSILQRLEAVLSAQTPRPLVEAAIGLVPQPVVTVSEAFKLYKTEIVPHELTGKSKGQKDRWTNGKQLSVDYFVAEVGDLAMDHITRDDARKFYDFWMKRIAPKEGKPTHTASSGNRTIGNIRGLYRDYFSHLGEHDRRNPFDELSFVERDKRKRPPMPVEWIRDVIMGVGKMAKLNAEARAIVLVLIETGARPSEICNLTASMISLEHKIPHLKIEPSEDPEDPREIKTRSSVRTVPLLGVALEAMRRYPNGFPRYKDKESSLSAALNKFFRENELMRKRCSAPTLSVFA